MPSQRKFFSTAHRRQIVLARFDHDATGRAQRSRPAHMHQPDAILHRGAEQSAAAANLDTLAVELDRHDVGPAATCLRRAANAFLSSRSSTPRAGSTADLNFRRKIFFSIHYSSFRALRSAFRARASRDSTACSLIRNIRAISETPISSTYLSSKTSRYSGRSSARARLNSRSAPASSQPRVFCYRSRAHEARASRIGADEREDLAMRNRARKGEQRAVTAKERQRVGERDEGLLQDVVGLVGRAHRANSR